MIAFTELSSLVPRQRIVDCFEIHIFHQELCDLLLSSREHVLLEICLCQCVFCKDPCYFGPHIDVAISVLRQVTINTVIFRLHFSLRLFR